MTYLTMFFNDVPNGSCRDKGFPVRGIVSFQPRRRDINLKERPVKGELVYEETIKKKKRRGKNDLPLLTVIRSSTGDSKRRRVS